MAVRQPLLRESDSLSSRDPADPHRARRGRLVVARLRRRQQLRDRFGPEYDKAVGDGQNRWALIQAKFVDRPDIAVAEADRLVVVVMGERGYPTEDTTVDSRTGNVDNVGRGVNPTPEPEPGAMACAEVLQSLAGTFTERKHELEGQWHGESEALTEDLRLALRRYRTFFNQLLDA